jgi:hypothetical protein
VTLMFFWLADFQCILGANELIHQLPAGADWHGETAGLIPLLPPGQELWPALKSGRLPAVLEHHGKKNELFSRE